MKASLHIGKGSANHNDRNFNVENAEHIDETIDNIYMNFVDNNKTFQSSEMDYYIKHYTKALDEQNERFRKLRQYKRMKSMEDIYKSKKTEPQEIILQVGNIDEHITGDELEMILVEFLQDAQNKYKNNFHVLNVAIHYDEATPHAHIRAVFDYEKNGLKTIGINEAMKEMDIDLPNPEKKHSRYNNRKMTFTKNIREDWYNVIENYGIKIDKTVINPSQKHKQALEYKCEQLEKEVQALEEDKSKLEQDKSKLEQDKKAIEEDRQKMELACFETTDKLDLLNQEIKDIKTDNKELKKQVQALEKEKSKLEEYKTELQNKTTKLFKKMRTFQNYYNGLVEAYEKSNKNGSFDFDDTVKASQCREITNNIKTFINKNDR